MSKVRTSPVFIRPGDFFQGGDDTWDQVAEVQPFLDGPDPKTRGLSTLGWVLITSTTGYTWMVAADEEVQTWLK